MKEILIAISILSIKLGDANEIATKIQIENNWLGFSPAKVEEIIKTEKRLKVELPNDYKEFLFISNGYSAPNTIEPTFMKVEDIDYLRNIDILTIESYNFLPELENSILIAGKDQEQYFLLIPPNKHIKKWRYWKFANWYPGEHEFESLSEYFITVKEFMEKEYKEKKSNCR